MASRPGTRRSRKNSDSDLAELAPQPKASPRSGSTRRATAAAVEEAVDVLSPEEEYLLRVFRRYCSPAVHSTVNDHHKAVPGSKRSPSPIPPRASKASSLLAKARRGAGGSGRGSAAVDISNASTLTAMTAGGEQDSTTENDESTAEPAIAPTDAVSRAKMILDKKRKAAAAARVSGIGSAAAASSGAAGVLRKAKISKTAGALLSATSARLDPVKYPASGLLLKREFRSFEESEEDGERVYVPVDPLIRNLTNFGVAESDGVGKKQGHETLVMRITVPPHSQSWGINIGPSKHSDFSEVLFHFNPRRRFVAMNNRENNIWGQQEKYMLPRWPDMFNVSITIAIQIDRKGFHIAVDGKYCATFTHRSKIPSNGEDLTFEVMTADDYGTNLGLVVHELWWGHKDTMPGLPGAAKERQPTRSTTESWRAGDNDDAFIDLHVGNLPPMPAPDQQEAVRKRLADMFQPYGAIQVRVFHREKNFGFIKFRDHNDAAKALEEMSGAEVQGRTMRLSKAVGR